MNLLNLKQLIAMAELKGATNSSEVYIDAYDGINVITPLGELATDREEGILLDEHKVLCWEEVEPDMPFHPDKVIPPNTVIKL